jgi:hypothetical protein
MTSLVAKALLIAILASSLQLVVAVDSGLCAEQKKCINPGAQSCTPEGKRVVCVTRSNDNGCPGNGPSDMPSDVCTWTREGGTGVVEFNWAVGWATKYCFEVENDQEVLFFMRGDRECDGEAEIDMRWSSGLQHGTAKCHASNGSLCKHWTFPESFYQDNAVKYAEAYNWKTNADGQYKPTSPSLPQGCVWRIKVRGCPVPDVRTCSDLDTGIHCPGCYEVSLFLYLFIYLFIDCVALLRSSRTSGAVILWCIRTCW